MNGASAPCQKNSRIKNSQPRIFANLPNKITRLPDFKISISSPTHTLSQLRDVAEVMVAVP
jgi:hypothetical protein